MGETRRTSSSRLAFAAAFVVLVVGLFVALGGTAYAQDTPAGVQYAGQDEEIEDVFTPPVANRPETGIETESGVVAETLPFSGLSLLGTALLGAALVATGLLLRRREKKT
jgi:hypothetical protein